MDYLYDNTYGARDVSEVVPTEPPIASGLFDPPDGQAEIWYYYAASVIFTGGTAASYDLTGTLPFGLDFDDVNCIISGVPLSSETVSGLSVTGTNVVGTSDPSNEADITIEPELQAPVFSGTIGNESFTIDVAITPIDYSGYFSTGGVVATYSMANAPTGLTIHADTGVVSGTPTVEATSSNVTITGTNATGSDTSNIFTYDVTGAAELPVFIGTFDPPDGYINDLPSAPIAGVFDPPDGQVG